MAKELSIFWTRQTTGMRRQVLHRTSHHDENTDKSEPSNSFNDLDDTTIQGLMNGKWRLFFGRWIASQPV